ncbi:MAG: endopeptidase La [Ardenticatenaceae bacterium]|nr:endopeptidase La [Ardenticatenaceae bacterium]
MSDTDIKVPEQLPILPLRGLVVYPLTAVPLNIGQPRSIKLINDASESEQLIGLFTSHDPEQKNPGPDDIYRMGTVATVRRVLHRPDNTMRLLVNSQQRVRIRQFTQTEPYLIAEVEIWPEQTSSGTKIEALARNVIELFLQLAEFVPSIPGSLLAASLNPESPLQLAYTIATHLRLELDRAQQFLEIDNVQDKLNWLIRHIGREIEIVEMGQQIRLQAFGQMEQAQREYFLREQLKAIHQQLGEEDERTVEVADFRAKIEAAAMPEEARSEAERELSRLPRLPIASPEYSVVRNYLDWLTGLPWNHATVDNLDLAHARHVLDEDHYGLEEIKDRIVEYLAVRHLRQMRQRDDEPTASYRHDRTGAILCFAGPPGVGKTSLGRSIARAMGREFIRLSLGGVRDEAEIRGHRRTYVGAMPGRVIQAIRRVGSQNPVIMLDEADKLGSDFRGDPASALLELLDPEQNREFRDHYLDVPFDLSAAMFITTANYLDAIPGPLRDRMEILQLSGYTEMEKVAIAHNYLVPRQISENGLCAPEIEFDTPTLQAIIQDYTREAGVRNLERQIGRICRKVATEIAMKTADSPITITADNLIPYLGPVRYLSEAAHRTQIPGVATGLAWTSVGGELLFVESARMPGSKGLTITGQLGDIMRESAQAALSYIRSQAEKLGVDADFFDKSDIHIHVPAGSIPKDGPSAGITIATALASLLTGQPVNEEIGMTGEITLRGQVMPIGGLKEKVLAAHRAGLKKVILPQRNKPDLNELPEEVRATIDFICVDHIDEVLEIALKPET